MMGTNFVPDDVWNQRLSWRNPFENPTTAQFVHRCLAYSAVAWATGLWVFTRRAPVPAHLKRLSSILLGVVWAQGSLGLLTLLYSVPIPLASAHQGGSMVALTSATVLLSAVKRTK
jgi:cytochrome c oxidase assembly protein subunit 15